jgi:ketosteroid isomerase-like protein
VPVTAESGERDRARLRELVDEYAAAVDRRDSRAVAAMFTADGVLEVWSDPESASPTLVHDGRAAIERAIAALDGFYATVHATANHSATIDGDVAVAQTRCLAHHVTGDLSAATDTVLAVNYVDLIVRDSGRWLFARRQVRMLWQMSIAADRPA